MLLNYAWLIGACFVAGVVALYVGSVALLLLGLV